MEFFKPLVFASLDDAIAAAKVDARPEYILPDGTEVFGFLPDGSYLYPKYEFYQYAEGPAYWLTTPDITEQVQDRMKVEAGVYARMLIELRAKGYEVSFRKDKMFEIPIGGGDIMIGDSLPALIARAHRIWL